MPVTMDDQLKEHIPYDSTRFPISFFHDELADLPQWNGPLHCMRPASPMVRRKRDFLEWEFTKKMNAVRRR